MKLPVLLSGPILRRTESNKLTIWLATSQSVHIKGHVYHITQQEKTGRSQAPQDPRTQDQWDYRNLHVRTHTHSVSLGDHLFIYLIDLTPTAPAFPKDTFLGYNLTFEWDHSQFDLGSLGLLSPEDPDSIVYSPFKLPTFIINENVSTNILYGSCRKFHGKGNDQLPEQDRLMNRSADQLEARPQALFLMGDQIYADDVGASIRPFLTKMGRRLLGTRSESLTEVDPRLTQSPFPMALQQVNGRQYIMEEFAQFTSSHASNHLMTFGEYAAMYLMNWSPTSWNLLEDEGGMPTFNEVLEKDQLYTVFPKDDPYFKKSYTKELKNARKQFKSERKSIKSFAKGLPEVRRLLANLATYMIFDDHDITDDWNLSHQWRQNVWHSTLGKHVVANGLLAYWAFQGWGNQTDAFSPRFIQTIKDYVTHYDTTSETYDKWLNQMWSFSDWAFVAPTNPMGFFLDTRTMRGYVPIPEPVHIWNTQKETPMSSELISTEGWEIQEKILFKSGWKRHTPLIIVSATPLYGIQLIENFVIKYIYPLRSLGLPVENSFDIEAWKDNGKGFTQFLRKLDHWDPDPCFILSGDVHYGFEAETHIRFPEDSKARVYYQLTSSPIKNKSFSGLPEFLVRQLTRIHSPTKALKEDHHYCDNHYRLLAKKQLINDPTTVNWSEKIYYQPNASGQIMETKNNIGILQIHPNYKEAKTALTTDLKKEWNNKIYRS